MEFKEKVLALLKELKHFNYTISSTDLIWDLIFPDSKGKWNHVRVTKYQKDYYVHHIDGNNCALEIRLNKQVEAIKQLGFSFHEDGSHDPASVWMTVITSALAWLKTVQNNWISANKRMQVSYPLNCRYGIVPHALVRDSLTDVYRLDKKLGKAKSRKFIHLVEEGYFHKDQNTIKESMAAKDYFNYCKIAYIAGKRKDDNVIESLSGREMYKRYADGRHEGLLDIETDSQQEFSDWIDGLHPKRTRGGHPWEIKRGGNTTHIDLSVYRPLYRKEGFKIELQGAAIHRLEETIKMFLAIQDASLPISISDPEGIRKRLLAQDNIGIIPSYDSLHRANQYFREDQAVYDVMHYDDLGRYKRRITPFITWEPLPVITPRDI